LLFKSKTEKFTVWKIPNKWSLSGKMYALVDIVFPEEINSLYVLELFMKKYGCFNRVVAKKSNPNIMSWWRWKEEITKIGFGGLWLKVYEQPNHFLYQSVLCKHCDGFAKYTCINDQRLCLESAKPTLHFTLQKYAFKLRCLSYWVLRHYFPKDIVRQIIGIHDGKTNAKPCAMCKIRTILCCKRCKNRYYCSQVRIK
jgi:hypothetical protein